MKYQPAYNTYSTRDPQYSADCDSELDISLSEKPASTSDDFLSSLIGGQLRYDFLSADTIRQMIYEREALRSKNRNAILGLISDVSGEISCCENLSSNYSINTDAAKRLGQLQKSKMDLERQLLVEDTDLWRDTFMLKRDLVTADRQYSSTRMRTGLFAGNDGNYDTKQGASSMGAGYLSGITADYRNYSR